MLTKCLSVCDGPNRGMVTDLYDVELMLKTLFVAQRSRH